jgi:2-keto-4-pentenoate hydratase/2-oxohepta-3-ene-1,7-dioic acid hydratase in catechol pathway
LCDQVIAHITQFVTLLPGDLIYLGTPAGTRVESAKKVGFKNVHWLSEGDIITTTIEGLGSTSNKIVKEAAKL